MEREFRDLNCNDVKIAGNGPYNYYGASSLYKTHDNKYLFTIEDWNGTYGCTVSENFANAFMAEFPLEKET